MTSSSRPYSCAPPLLSRTSSSSIMSSLTNVSATLPLSRSILPWLKSSKHDSRSSTTWSLPSIAHFDRPPPPSPPTQWREPHAQSGSDPFDSYESSPVAGPSNPPSPPPSVQPAPPPPDSTTMSALQWFWVGPHPSSQTIAEKTCQMVCYLWFSNTLGAPKSSPHRGRTTRKGRSAHSPSDPPSSLSDASTAALQFTPSEQFMHFMHKLLQTTQVSQSVIVLSLHYIYRLKEENHFTSGQAGSEFRVAVVALMMANKFVDDNTYTNKTWSEVSGIELNEINKMEREFLVGVNFRLYVNTETYKAWVNLLQGLVSTKERDEQQWQYAQRRTSGAPIYTPVPRHATPGQQRARSSSPLPSLKAPYPFTFVAPTYANPFTNSPRPDDSSVRPGAKRPAVMAFSPPSATLPGPPPKRPISLDMSIVRSTPGPSSANSSYPLSAFAQLSLDRSEAPSRATPAKARQLVEAPQTLAAPYRLQERNAEANPQNLYYYTLVSSPASADDAGRVRKAVLRSHQPVYHYPTPPYVPPAPPPQPMYIQSASASPAHYPPFRQPHPYAGHLRPHDRYATANFNTHSLVLPPIRMRDDDNDRRTVPPQSAYHVVPQQPPPHTQVPVAPFANAGPPGVQWGSHEPAYHYAYAPHYAYPQQQLQPS